MASCFSHPWWRVKFTLVALAVLLVGLLNGSGFYLRRIGLLDQRLYRAELKQFCDPPIPRYWLPARCRAANLLSRHPLRVARISLNKPNPGHGPYLISKLVKLFLLVSLVGEGLRRFFSIRQAPHLFVSHWLKGCRNARLPDLAWLAPALPLLLSTGLSLVLSAASTTGLQTLASLVSAGWLLLIPLGGWLSRRSALASLAQAVAALVALQLPLVLIEAMRGLPMAFGPWVQSVAPDPLGLPSRMVGTFVHPNSLGAAAVCGFGFCLAFLPQRRLLPWLWAIGVSLVLAARSAAGLLGLLLLGLWWCRSARRLPPRLLASVLVVLGLLVFPAAPRLLGRPDLWQSLQGRLELFLPLLDPAQPFQLLFGRGLAAYSNQLASWLGPGHGLVAAYSDGMPALLLIQGGLVALFSFYSLLFWAWRLDPGGRPFLFAAALTSLTLNVTELTPFGLLLGIALNRALLLGPIRPWPAGDERVPNLAAAVQIHPDP